jgi:hypothetical protein
MKLAVLLSACVLGVSAWPHGGSSSSEEEDFGLPHFDKDLLSSDMKEYKISSAAECTEEINQCIARVHRHAQQCVGMWHQDPAQGPKLRECESDNAEVKAADQAWQEASEKYHVGLGKCLAGEDVPEEESFFFFRRKRHTNRHEGHMDSHSDEEYESARDCWIAMQDHKKECMETMTTCPRMLLCNGLGPQPEGEGADWWEYVKDLREDKEEKVKEHKRLLKECMGTDPHWQQEEEE